MAFVICEPCVDVKDTACVKVCPVDCIYEFEGERQLYIHPSECIDCAACQPECPVQAIFPEAEVPQQWHSYIALNRDIFEKHAAAAPAAGADAATEATETAAVRPAAAVHAPRPQELPADRLLRILQAVEDGTLDPDVALIQLTGATPAGAAPAPARPAEASPRPTTPAPPAEPVSRFDAAVPAAVVDRQRVVPDGYREERVPVEPPAREEPPSPPPLPRPNLAVRGAGGFLLWALQPLLGALPARAKYLLEGYAGARRFSAASATWSNIVVNLTLYFVGALALAASTLGEDWAASGLTDLLLFLGVLAGFGEGLVRAWSAMFDPDAPAHQHYKASLYGWASGWLVWPVVEALVRPAARSPEADIRPPDKPIPGGEVHFVDELEKRRRYGMVHHVAEEPAAYVVTLELPRRTPEPLRTRFNLPPELPDYDLRVSVEEARETVAVEGVLDDPRFAMAAGRSPGFPSSFLTQFRLPGVGDQFQTRYADKTLTIRIERRDRVSPAA
jgi:NAD-dependent dihydropyrimidine dehydrogenase PreA subunit